MAVTLTTMDIKRAALEVQHELNLKNGTDYAWNCQQENDHQWRLEWTYLGIPLLLTLDGNKVSCWDCIQEVTLRCYLIGKEFWCQYKDADEALRACVKSSVRKCNSIY